MEQELVVDMTVLWVLEELWVLSVLWVLLVLSVVEEPVLVEGHPVVQVVEQDVVEPPGGV